MRKIQFICLIVGKSESPRVRSPRQWMKLKESEISEVGSKFPSAVHRDFLITTKDTKLGI